MKEKGDNLDDKSEKLNQSFSFKIKSIGNSKKSSRSLQPRRPKNQDAGIDYITEVQDKSIKSLNAKIDRGPLVIPLTTNNWVQSPNKVKSGSDGQKSSQSSDKKTGKEKTLDEKAAEELLREIRNDNGQNSKSESMFMTDKIIKMNNDKQSGGGENVPVLIANAIPGLKEIEDENERFQKDVDMRADDMDFKSDAYRDTPIEEFGAALLRGMGWEGPKENGDKGNAEEEMAPRHFRLGLGAAPKPVEDKRDRPGRKRKPGEKKTDANKEWVKLAKEKARKQQLRRGDVVLITSHQDPEIRGKRGRILKTQESVPGLDNLLLSLEQTGDEVVLKKQSLLLISPEEIDENPFKDSKSKSRHPVHMNGARSQSRSSSRSRSHDSTPSKDKKTHKKRKRKKKDKERTRSKSREKKSDKKRRRKDAAGDAPKNKGFQGPPSGWLVENIRVRVVSEHVAKGKFFRKKGVVVEVPVVGQADVRMDSGVCLEGVKERYLETALPPTGGKVLILRGRHKYSKGKVLEKNLDTEKASVHLSNDLEIIRVSLDDIAEYVI